MANTEFTKKELLELLKDYEIEGKLSFDSLGKIVFDSKFPEHLFENAKKSIIEARNDEARHKELLGLLNEKYPRALEIQTNIYKLSFRRTENEQTIKELTIHLDTIMEDIKHIEKEFKEVSARIDERKGE